MRGQATFGVPCWSPRMPRASTISRLCGQRFSQAYHLSRLANRKTAIWDRPSVQDDNESPPHGNAGLAGRVRHGEGLAEGRLRDRGR